MSAWWSWTLAVVGLLGAYLAGRKLAVGWLIRLAAQVLWVAYALISHQWGFIATAVAFGVVYGRNWLLWRDQDPRMDGTRRRHERRNRYRSEVVRRTQDVPVVSWTQRRARRDLQLPVPLRLGQLPPG